MNRLSTSQVAKFGQKPFGSDNEWTVHYVNRISSGEAFWRAVAAGKPPECADIIARYGRYVQPSPDGCWLWTGSRTGSWKGGSHGQFALWHGENIYAHRLSYLLFNGPIPNGGVVRHTCDVGYCVRPSHLLAGTQLDNMRDAVERGRLPKFRKHRKISPSQVIDIRRLKLRGVPQSVLAQQFGVSEACISNIVNLKTRRYLPSGSGETRRVSWLKTVANG